MPQAKEFNFGSCSYLRANWRGDVDKVGWCSQQKFRFQTV